MKGKSGKADEERGANDTFTFLIHTFKFKSDVQGGLLKGKSGKADEERGANDWAALPSPVVFFGLASLVFPRQNFCNLILHVRLTEENFF